MFRDEFKSRYTTIPFAIYRADYPYDSTIVFPHHHREAEIIAMTNGCVDFYIDAQCYNLKKGDVLLIPPYSVHRAEFLPDTEAAYNCVCIDLSLLCDEKIKSGFINHTLSIKDSIRADSPCASEIQALVERGCNACESNCAGWELIATGSISTLFGILKMNGFFVSDAESTSEAKFTQSAMTYIEKNYSDAITSTSAAANLYMSLGYFCRMFKKTFGYCFSDYVLSYRLEKARSYLLRSKDKITDISSKVGFNGCSYFGKAFRERFGVTPREYRKSINKTDGT